MKGLKDKVITLKNEGKNYKEIMQELNCSKGTVYYHLKNPTQKERIKIRCRDFKKKNPLKIKISNFKSSLIEKTITARRNNKTRKIEEAPKFKISDLINKIGDSPKCYLTGRDIDINNSKEYHLDHIIPKSRGGTNELDNIGITCRNANQAKCDMFLEEFFSLCKDVLQNNGYVVTKKI